MDETRDTMLTAALHEIASEWRRQNDLLFRGQLRPPVFGLLEGDRRLGEWFLGTRTMAFSARLLVEEPWARIVEVLKHEMAHQYVHESLGVLDEPAHGPAFRRVCEERAIDHAASGMPQVLDEGDDRVLRKVQRLLALATSDNKNEAESAMAAAQKLMLEHELDVAALHAPRGYAFAQLGQPKGRIQKHEKILAHILVSHFFVQAILVPSYRQQDGARGHVLEICGSRANLEMAGYVHDFLTRTAEALWREHKRAHGVSSDRDRLPFLAGVMRGFDEKLSAQKKQSRERGLVWRGDPALEGFFGRRHPHIRRTRVAGSGGFAHDSGVRAGRDIVLQRPVEAAAESRGRALPAARR